MNERRVWHCLYTTANMIPKKVLQRSAHKPLNENLMKIVFNLETLTLLSQSLPAMIKLFNIIYSLDGRNLFDVLFRWTLLCFWNRFSVGKKKRTEKEKVAKATQLSFAVWHLWEFKDYCYFIIICLVLLVDSRHTSRRWVGRYPLSTRQKKGRASVLDVNGSIKSLTHLE